MQAISNKPILGYSPVLRCAGLSTPASRRTVQCYASTVNVIEHLLVLKVDPDTPHADELIDTLWSCQYRVRGALTACAGPVDYMSSSSSSDAPPGITSNPWQPLLNCTHAVLYRFPNRQVAASFLSSSAMKEACATIVSMACTGSSSITFEGQVENDMEALFRRTGDYAEGAELIMLLQESGSTGSTASTASSSAQAGTQAPAASTSSGAQGSKAQRFLVQLASLAQSSLAGAVQVSHGPVVGIGEVPSTTWASSGAAPGLHVFMARFPSQDQLQAFLAIPPVKALSQAQGVKLPLRSVMEMVLKVEPADQTRRQANGMSG